MDLLKVENIASVSLFDLRLSEGELMVYEGCIEHVLKTCDENTIRQLTGCASRDELVTFQADLLELIREHVTMKYRLARLREDDKTE